MTPNHTADHHRLIDTGDFYAEYHGHKVSHLTKLLPALRESSDRLIWLAGDSSLDNKYWFNSRKPAVGAYRNVLSPPWSITDVNYWLNKKLTERNSQTAAINTAVEASTLNERSFGLRAQDRFLRENIQPNDILVVSVGGNDVALMPCPCTIASILGLLFCLPQSCMDKGFTCGSCPLDDCCCGCGFSLASCACAFPPCLGFLRHLFGTRTQHYIRRLTARRTPHKICVLMIYFPDEALTPSWAGGALAALGYNNNPSKLQALIRKAFVEATSNIHISGAQVIPVPLYHVLDGKNSEDYIARVEPSPIGGEKMATYILDMIDNAPIDRGEDALFGSSGLANPPIASYMNER
jgi:hypothetical protein